MSFQLYREANRYLDEGLIRTEVPEEGTNPRTRRQWMEAWLPELGQPQKAYGAVHVAGTSGKGSVCTMVAEILRAAGVRTGLHVSPYLQVSTEKLWVDGRYASAEELAELVAWIRPHCEAIRGPWTPLHGMASVAVCLEHFRGRGVELAVMETGVGGRSDLTNVMQTRVALVTGVGWDHVKTLGPTLEDIAEHKAGIIKTGCRAVVFDGGKSPARAAAERQAAAVGAPLRVVRPGQWRGELSPDGTVHLSFSGRYLRLHRVPLGLAGAFQAQNAALALCAVEELYPDGGPVDAEAARRGLSQARIPGRLERIPAARSGACPVLLDGAHNPDKLAAMLGAVDGLLPAGARLHVVYGGLASRAPDAALCRLARRAQTFVVTEPRVYQKKARPTAEIAAVARDAAGSTVEQPDPARAVALALDAAGPGDLVLVTGSLYLCGEVRGLWYPPEQVVAEGTSWPAVSAPGGSRTGAGSSARG